MSDVENVMNEYERHRQAQVKANEVNKAVIFSALAAVNITAVHVEFDGAGDSGQINSVAAFIGDDVATLPNTTVAIQTVHSVGAEATTDEQRIEEAIETLCYGYLEETHGGWEINDGAYGEFQFDVAKRTINLDFNGRFSDVWSRRHTF